MAYDRGRRGVGPGRAVPVENRSSASTETERQRRLVARRIAGAVDTEWAFVELFGSAEWAYWLDSSRLDGGARFSLLGEAGACFEGGFDAVSRHLQSRNVLVSKELPAEAACGIVGYATYEGGGLWCEAARFVVVDHLQGCTYVAALDDPTWVGRTGARLTAHVGSSPKAQPCKEFEPPAGLDPEPWLLRGRARYLEDIAESLAHLRSGNSYEICLTNTIRLPYDRVRLGAPLDTYRRLRRLEPAPHAAYLRIGERHVLSASPECFLRVDPSGVAECRPIKGTAPRLADQRADSLAGKGLSTDPKTRAENLIIVDLLRNDLGKVCTPGSVEVPAYLSVESYATVHQLVSTVRGQLCKGIDAPTAAAACFPPGSMTGAPKPRTMEILAGLENRPRGIYSGALGWFGWQGGADLAVVIRTAVVDGDSVTVGAGGAITLDSDPEQEYAEMLLKAAVPLRAFGAPG